MLQGGYRCRVARASSLPSASAVMASSSILGSLSAIFNDVALYCTKVCKSQEQLINKPGSSRVSKPWCDKRMPAARSIWMQEDEHKQRDQTQARCGSEVGGREGIILGWFVLRFDRVGRVVEGRKVGETSRRRRVKIEQPRVRWRLFYRERLRIFSALRSRTWSAYVEGSQEPCSISRRAQYPNALYQLPQKF